MAVARAAAAAAVATAATATAAAAAVMAVLAQSCAGDLRQANFLRFVWVGDQSIHVAKF